MAITSWSSANIGSFALVGVAVLVVGVESQFNDVFCDALAVRLLKYGRVRRDRKLKLDSIELYGITE